MIVLPQSLEVGSNRKGEIWYVRSPTASRGKPCTIKSDNGCEFISKAMDLGANENTVELDFSRSKSADRNGLSAAISHYSTKTFASH
jgi:hypothetical protein